MAYQINIAVIMLLGFMSHLVFSLDLTKTEIKIVTDVDRYTTLNPNATYRAFDKVYHSKGNIIFSAGDRIDGDKLIMSFIDESQFARLVDVEVSMWYPNPGFKGKVLTFVEYVTDLSTTDADVYFVNDGGIGSTFAEILMVANRTTNFGYQIFMYGY